MLEPGTVEYSLSWIHTLLHDVMNELPTERCKNQIMKAIEHVEECEDMVEFMKLKESGE